MKISAPDFVCFNARKLYYCLLFLACLLPIIGQAKESALQDYQSSMVQANGLTFHYLEKGQGELMLFLHGFPYFSASWQPLLASFAKTHHVVAPDNRGYGLSDKPVGIEHYRIDKLVEDVRALVEHFSPQKKVIIVGHDWGGALAWAVAQKYPHLVSKLIVINAPPYNTLLHMLQTNEQQRHASSYMALLKGDKLEQKFATLGPELLWRFGSDKLFAKGYLDQQSKHVFFTAWQHPGALTGALNWYRANIPNFDEITDASYFPDKSTRVSVPSLLIRTENERTFVADTLDEVSKYVDDLTVEMILGSGHSPFIDQPKKVISAIQKFIQR